MPLWTISLIAFLSLFIIFQFLWINFRSPPARGKSLLPWELLFDSSPQPMGLFHLESRLLIHQNKAFASLFGTKNIALIDKGSWESRLKDLTFSLEGVLGSDHLLGSFLQSIKAKGKILGMELEVPKGKISQWFLVNAVTCEQEGATLVLLILGDISFHKEVEGILQRNNSFLEALLSGSPDPVFYTNQQGRITGYNKAFLNFFQINPDQALGQNLDHFFQSYGGQWSNKNRTKNRGSTFDMELKIGEKRSNVLVSQGSFLGLDKKPEGQIFILKDVSLIKEFQQQLIERDHLLQSLAQANATLIQASDPQEGLSKAFSTLGPSMGARAVLFMVFRPPQAKVLVQWDQDGQELLKKTQFPLGDFIQRYPFIQMGKEEEFLPEDWPGLSSALKIIPPHMLGLPILVDQELWGMVVFIKEHSLPWSFGEKSLLSSFSAAASGLIKETRFRDKIQKARANLFAFLDNAQGFFAALDEEDVYVSLNTQFQDLYESVFHRSPKIGESFWLGMDGEEQKLWILRFKRVRLGDSITFEWDTPSGVILMSLSPLYQREGIHGIAMVGTNIQERIESEQAIVKAKEEAEIANRSKGAFMANMSHEIRTPLNAVIGFSDLLEERIADPVEKSYLEAIKKSGKNLLLLINNILDLSKMESGHMELQKDFLDVSQICRDVVDVFGHKGRSKELEVGFLDESVGEILVEIDEVRFRQILLNLLGNGVKFTREGAVNLFLEVKPSLEEKDRVNLSVVVKDTGIGIKEDALELIFRDFQQQTGQSHKEYGGTGLGLAITKRLVIMMGGQISVTSKEGVGSIFTVEIPMLKFRPKDTEPEVFKEKHSLIFHNPNVLIVDDNSIDRLLLREFLKNHHVHIREASDAQKALEILKNSTPDLLITDLRMPKISGEEFLKTYISFEPDLPPIFIVTAEQREDAKRLLDGIPVAKILHKPLSKEELILAMGEILPHSEQTSTQSPEWEKALPPLTSLNPSSLPSPLRERILKALGKALESHNLGRIGDFNLQLRALAGKNKWEDVLRWCGEIQTQIHLFHTEKVYFYMGQMKEALEGADKNE